MSDDEAEVAQLDAEMHRLMAELSLQQEETRRLQETEDVERIAAVVDDNLVIPEQRVAEREPRDENMKSEDMKVIVDIFEMMARDESLRKRVGWICDEDDSDNDGEEASMEAQVSFVRFLYENRKRAEEHGNPQG